MARSKSAATQAVEPEDDDFGFDLSDGEVVAPGIDLRGKVKERKLQRGEKDPVAQAEAAMKRLETTFGIWIADETEKLLSAWKQAANTSFDAASREALFRSAHDIKGQAATLGFPVAGRIAGSLCRLRTAPEEQRKITHKDGQGGPAEARNHRLSPRVPD